MKKISDKQIIIKCHDEKAMTYDVLDLQLMDISDYFKCTRMYSNLECYQDTDLMELYEKIEDDWNNVKSNIHTIIHKKLYEIGFKQKGFCMIIEPILQGREVEINETIGE